MSPGVKNVHVPYLPVTANVRSRSSRCRCMMCGTAQLPGRPAPSRQSERGGIRGAPATPVRASSSGTGPCAMKTCCLNPPHATPAIPWLPQSDASDGTVENDPCRETHLDPPSGFIIRLVIHLRERYGAVRRGVYVLPRPWAGSGLVSGHFYCWRLAEPYMWHEVACADVQTC